MRLDSLKNTPDRAGRYWAVFDDGTKLGLYRQTVEDFGLYPGKELSGEEMERLRTAAELGVPYVVTPGALEMINLGSEDTLTDAQRTRVLYRHSPSSVKMRANREDMLRAAQVFVERLSGSRGNVEVLIPTRGYSMVNAEGKVFYDPQADAAFAQAVSAGMPSHVPVRLIDAHLNDAAFAAQCTERLLALMKTKGPKGEVL